ncbi:hypothetical protein [Paraburkholderia youngii]|uniref:hypothetical protein n=1 Tax=Paraburkholderia youngii TaxID=2782701 RepID=UPI00159245CE|nr:hypothetical protein [Paraburkholderia youngii]NUX58678.1 hypothetical protein [Paraburkholderia youngii]
MKRPRAEYSVQFGERSSSGRISDLMPCKCMRDAARVAANLAFVLHFPSDAYPDDNWLLTSEARDSIEYTHSDHFIKVLRTYPQANRR